MTPAKAPTTEQFQALSGYAARNGRNWKSKLKAAWWSGDDVDEIDGGLLRQVRNTLGPHWLTAFKPPFKTPPA